MFVLRVAILVCAVSVASAADPYETKEIKYTGGPYENEVFQYRLMKPANVEAGQSYPLVLFLHGAGERGTDNANQLKYLPRLMASDAHREKFPCYVLAPQCRSGKQWVNVPWSDVESTPLPKEPSHQLRVAIAILERTLKEEQVDRDRVYLTGLSMGGFGSWDLAARHPDWFAAVAPICGGGDEATAKSLAGLPIWVFHGGADTVVKTVRSQRMVAALKEAGGDPKYTEFPGVGHNSWTPAYEKTDLLNWMFEQRRKKRNE